ncbi:MAG: hypothetical protein ACJAZ1_002004 [Yoonia sp.]|jgi:hypothetical protein
MNNGRLGIGGMGNNEREGNPTLAAEMLAEHHGLMVTRETPRKWIAEDGL